MEIQSEKDILWCELKRDMLDMHVHIPNLEVDATTQDPFFFMWELGLLGDNFF